MKQKILTLIGAIILIIVFYFAFGKDEDKEKQKVIAPPAPVVQQTPPTIAEPSAPPVDPNLVTAEFEYKKDAPTTPKVVRVEEGQKVVIKATADVIDEVHLHGYNNSVPVKPGELVSLEFTASKTGRFPVELEKLKKDIGIIEVYPK